MPTVSRRFAGIVDLVGNIAQPSGNPPKDGCRRGDHVLFSTIGRAISWCLFAWGIV